MTWCAVSKPRTHRLTLSSSRAASRWDGLIWSSDTPWRTDAERADVRVVLRSGVEGEALFPLRARPGQLS